MPYLARMAVWSMEPPSRPGTSRQPVCPPPPADADYRYTAFGPGNSVRVPGETVGTAAQHQAPPARYAGLMPVACSTACHGPELVAQRTGYQALDARIAKTAANRALLLVVLEHPEVPLHNNAMELAARRRVRKRDVSFGPQSRGGARAWDTFQTISATAAKLGVRLYHYLCDRLQHPTTTPSLADRIEERSRSAILSTA